MHLKFSPVDEKYIKEKVSLGFYSGETEVVKDAVRRMREEEEKMKRFQVAVRIGDQQIANGEAVAYDKDLIDQVTQNAIQRAQDGEKPNSDVTP